VTLHLGKKALFEGLTLRVADHDRIGLVGPNGSGKTSLLRLIDGEVEADDGTMVRRRGTRLGFLPQELDVPGGMSLLAFIRARIPGRDELHQRIEHVEHQLHHPEIAHQDDAALEESAMELAAELAELSARLAAYERDYADHAALRILAGLGFRPGDEHRDLGEFSGGWRMRAVLGSLLFLQPDLLLLDEPTNHLDMPSVAWLGAFLQRYNRPFFLICHDREFLNEQINRVVSFEPEGVRQYTGNYEEYLTQREAETEILQNRAKNLERAREHAERFIERFRYQASKAKAVQSRVRALEKLDEVETLEEHGSVHFVFPPTAHTSKQVLRTEGLTKGYGGPPLFSGINLSVMKGERIGVLGVNGAGKTTLLKLLAGVHAPDAGTLTLGQHVNVGYFAQDHRETLHSESSVLEEVARKASGQSPRVVRSLLGGLGFSGDDVDKPVNVLSGGERARVALARLLVAPAPVLVMDEPTNHLDVRSAERLVESLLTFDGTLIFASHNKSFVRHLATRIWNVGNGTVETFPGTLDEYLTSALRQLELPEERQKLTTDGGNDTAPKRENEKDRRRREAEERSRRRTLMKPIEDRLAHVEAEITAIEAAQKRRQEQLAEPATYSDAAKSADLNRALHRDAQRLNELNTQWEAIGEELAAAEATLAVANS